MSVRSNKIIGVFATAVLIAGAFAVLQGCTGKTPASPVFAIPPAPVLASNIIDDFEDGNISMSTDLVGAVNEPTTQYVSAPSDPNDPSSPMVLQPVSTGMVPLGVWIASSWGPNNKVNNPYVYQDGQGALGSNGYIRLWCKPGGLVEPPIVPPAIKALYVAYQLEGKLCNGYPYDALTPGFTGVRFYYKLGSADTCAAFRRFDVAIQQTLPIADGGDGTCQPDVANHDCFDHFGAFLPAAPTNTWSLRSYTFVSLTRRSFGEPLTGNLLDYRSNFVKLVWQHGLNGVPGSATVDYWVDQVEFF